MVRQTTCYDDNGTSGLALHGMCLLKYAYDHRLTNEQDSINGLSKGTVQLA